MVNPFLSSKNYDTTTAVMLEKAYITDIKNAVAYTDGNRIFLNTADNLYRILPAYDDNMLKWLLWHEKMHLELRHHARFFKYKKELEEEGKSILTHAEVNIIMDILVHDWLSKKFPELVETAKKNLAQFRDQNSLNYTFKTYTLEEMLDEYKKFKEENSEAGNGNSSSNTNDEPENEKEENDTEESTSQKDNKSEQKNPVEDIKNTDQETNTTPQTEHTDTPKDTTEGHHNETDWSQLEDIDETEFIDTWEGQHYIDKINKLKNTKIKLAQITQTLNSLVTTTNIRTYKTPSHMQTGQHTIFKGRQPGKAALYLCFDASGSMNSQMQLFKDIISKSIPQALKTPTLWFSGCSLTDKGKEVIRKCKDPDGRNSDYYKGTFEDFLNIMANDGYGDDGDRTIELCWRAEQLGYSPIGVTDGGGMLDWSIDLIKQLKRTVLVGQRKSWLKEVQKINPRIQIIYISE